MFWKKQQGLFILILVSGALLAWRYDFLLLKLDQPQVMDQFGDGFKTYTNTIYHARFDKDNSFFGGMNYPYKEHIMAATELPGIAMLVKWLTPQHPNLPNYTYGIIHLLLIVSIWLCAIFLYLIFRSLSLPTWYSILVAIGITFLSPQNFRFVPHMGLAPLFILPAVIYGLIRLNKAPGYGKAIFLTLMVFVASMIHFYFFAICQLTIGLFFVFDFLQNKKLAWLKTNLKYYGMIWVVPTTVFLKWMMVDDPIQDRSPKPWGFLFYRSKWEGLFTFKEVPPWNWIHDNIVKIEKVDFEGWAYVGLVAALFVHIALLVWLFNRFKQQLVPAIDLEQKKSLMPLLGMAVVLVFLACSQPFATEGFGWLLKYFGFLRQFRSTGRFAWVFYYAINIIAFTSIYQILSKKTAWFRNIGLALVLSTLLFEAWEISHNKHIDKPLIRVALLQDGNQITEASEIDFNAFQAILPVPYFNVGSNNFGNTAGANIIQYGTTVAMQTGLPLTGAMLTRSSRSQAFRQMQLVALPYEVPAVFQDYPSQKPLLLLVSNFMTAKDSLKFSHLLDEVQILYEGKDFNLYKMELESFSRRIAARKATILGKTKQAPLLPIEAFMSTDSVKNFYFNDFDLGNKKENQFFECPSDEVTTIFSGKLPNQSKDVSYELLFWDFVNEDRFRDKVITIEEIDGDGKILGSKTFLSGNQAVEYRSDGFILVQVPFQFKSSSSSFQVRISMDEPDKGKLFKLDELLIKPANIDLYKFNGNSIWWNNRFFE